MNILRVFPHRTSFTPVDEMAFIGLPPFEIPEHNEVHVSCTFTWDKPYCRELQFQWQARTNKPVKLGGVAFGDVSNEFVQGRYVKSNIIFTSRGCNNNCTFCGVPKYEGKIKELPICEGNIIQDNNFLQCSRSHKEKVFEMLKKQKEICFKGGLQPNLVDDHFIKGIQDLRIKELWIACDSRSAIDRFMMGVNKLKNAGFNQNKIHCFVLIGDDRAENEDRLCTVYKAGAMPFAQLRQGFDENKIDYTVDWKKFQRMWSRPAATRAHVEKGTHYNDFNT
jgi:hypothetical protein